MRWIAVSTLLLGSACSVQTGPTRETCPACGVGSSSDLAAVARSYAETRARPDMLSGSPATPQDPAAARENALLEDALSGRPDYTAALRRAAIANLAEQPNPLRERPAQREERIEAEVARLSDAVEKRRRARLALQGQREQAGQTAAARAAQKAACDAQASAVGANQQGGYSPRAGILGSALTNAITSSAAEEQARAGCYRAYGL